MTTEASSSMAVPVLTGALTGLLAWAGLNIWFGIPMVATTDNLPSILKEPPPSAAAAVAAPAGPTDPGEAAYAVCAACHQANGQGLPGAFPPLANSSWVNEDPETPIRIVIAGLSGPVKVNGADFNSMMPPPPGMDDEKIALALTYVRSKFGNNAAAITKEQVAAVRSSLGGRSSPFNAEELIKLRPAAGAKPAGDAPAAPAAADPAAKPEDKPAPGAAPAAKP